MSFFSVDRFEEDFAVLVDENGVASSVKRDALPSEIKEGSVLSYVDGKYSIDKNEEKRRRKRILSLQNKIFKD